jgi:hypothetical protein
MLPIAHVRRHGFPKEGAVSLRCALGYHTATGVPRWNDGHYFARCARCRVDLVRTTFSRWEVPRGYRVVWQSEPPQSRPDVTLEPELDLEPAAAPAAPEAASAEPSPPPPAESIPTPAEKVAEPAPTLPAADLPGEKPALPSEKPEKAEKKRVRLPVEALLERLRGTPEQPPAPPARPPSAPSPPRPRPDWDFMMDPGERARSAGAAPTRSAVQAPARSAIDAPAPAPEPPTPTQAQPAAAGETRPESRRSPSILSRAVSRLRSRAGPAFQRVRHNKRFAQAAISAAVLAFMVAAVLWLPARPAAESAPPAATPPIAVVLDPQDAQTEAAPPQLEAAPAEESFVAARALSCRDAPALQARRVRVLARGASVQVLARDGDWVSLATRAGQCWALGKYVSEPRPL